VLLASPHTRKGGKGKGQKKERSGDICTTAFPACGCRLWPWSTCGWKKRKRGAGRCGRECGLGNTTPSFQRRGRRKTCPRFPTSLYLFWSLLPELQAGGSKGRKRKEKGGLSPGSGSLHRRQRLERTEGKKKGTPFASVLGVLARPTGDKKKKRGWRRFPCCARLHRSRPHPPLSAAGAAAADRGKKEEKRKEKKKKKR